MGGEGEEKGEIHYVRVEEREGQVSVAIGIYTGEGESWHGISIRERGDPREEGTTKKERSKKPREGRGG